MTEINANINYGALKKLVQEMSKSYSVKVGLLANEGGNDEVSANLDMAGLGAVQEFGAEIDNPGGQPYFINKFGMATFVKKDSFYGQLLIKRGQVTKPHKIKIPARSWLQFPLTRNNGADVRNKIKEKTELTKADKELLQEFISSYGESGMLKELALAVARSSVEQIDEAFETQGFGEWQPNAPVTIRKKGSEDPLIDTGDFRRRITYEIEEK